MATDDGLRYVDSDGHILEHPTAMPEYAPAEYRDRIWHIETDEAGEEWLRLQREPHPGERHGRGRGRRGERRGPRQRVPRRDALHRDASGGLERQGPPPGHGPGPHRPGGAVPHDAARAPERDATSTSPRRRPAPTTTGAPTTSPRARAGCSAPARCRPCTSPTTSSGWRRRSVAWPTLPGMVSVFMRPNPVDRLAAVQRPGLRPALAGGVRHRAADRAAPVPRRRPARRVHGPAPEPAPQARRPLRRRLRPRTPTDATTSSWRTPSCARPTSSPRRSRTRST